MKKNKNYIWIIILILALIIIDQISKIYAIQNEGNNWLFININLIENKGGAFGIGYNSTFSFIVTNIVVIGIIIKFMMMQKEQLNKAQLIFLSSILAGGISNLGDRIFRGYVVDFIKIGEKFPIINLADIYIFCGWVLLALIFAKHSYDEIKREKAHKKNI